MVTSLGRLTQNYTPAFLTFLGHPNEEALHSAYELGRAALTDNVTLLDLIRTHHQVFGDVLRATTNPDDSAISTPPPTSSSKPSRPMRSPAALPGNHHAHDPTG